MKQFMGIWPGIVVSRDDPERKGRIRVRAPQVYGAMEAEHIADADLPWATPCFPFAGKSSGFSMIPEVGSGVWLMFYGGDPGVPIYLGAWYGHADGFPEQAPENFVIKTPLGCILSLDDSQATPGVLLQDATQQEMKFDSLQGKISIRALQNLEGTSGQDLSLNSGGQMTLSAGLLLNLSALAAITISAIAACTISAGAALTITAVGALQLLGLNVVLGQAATAQKLCNKAMMDLYNSHTHVYTLPQHPGGPGATSVPTQQGIEDTHTTSHVRCS